MTSLRRTTVTRARNAGVTSYPATPVARSSERARAAPGAARSGLCLRRPWPPNLTSISSSMALPEDSCRLLRCRLQASGGAVRRREFFTLVGGAAVAGAWPLALRAQQAALPVVGFVNTGSAEGLKSRASAFRKGLSETGFVEGKDVTIEYHWLEGRTDQLAAVMADLVRRKVSVIATPGSVVAALAAKAATSTGPDRIRCSRRSCPAWPCRKPRPARRQRDRHQYLFPGSDRQALAAVA